jgi:hypothetical protein
MTEMTPAFEGQLTEPMLPSAMPVAHCIELTNVEQVAWMASAFAVPLQGSVPNHVLVAGTEQLDLPRQNVCTDDSEDDSLHELDAVYDPQLPLYSPKLACNK